MTQEPSTESTTSPLGSIGALIAIAVGNTRTRVGSFQNDGPGNECLNPQSFDSSDPNQIAARVNEIVESALDNDSENQAGIPTVILSTVSPPHADNIERAIREIAGQSTYRFGRDLRIPVQHTLTETGEMTVGQDRLLTAIGAFDTLKQACVVIDAGTAVTIDFVDGEGTFHGGAILPGINMMLNSLNDSAANLPKLVYKKLDKDSNEPAKQTDDAIMLGVTSAIRGAVRLLTERYAEHYSAYPQTIVTGGDLGILEDEELIDTFAPDLQLQGIRVACAQIIDQDDQADD